MKLRIAVDVGASSGRVMLGGENAREPQEIYRFANGMVEIDGQLCWDVEGLVREIVAGIRLCVQAAGGVPCSVGICTWGVDFVLLDENRQRLGNAVAYRDNRTNGMREKVHSLVPAAELFARTGLQPMPFNTLYQLMALKEQQPEWLEKAAHFLLMPDYLHYRLCGAMVNEYTNATTTGLVHVQTRQWDGELLARLGFPSKLFGKLTPPGTSIGRLTDYPACEVIVPATHDTASAVMCAQEDAIFISSGTWSVMGVLAAESDTSEAARLAGFSSEGGCGGFVFCTNIMGLWMIQCVRQELQNAGQDIDYATLCELAEAAEIDSAIDASDEAFFSPISMIEAIRNACETTGQPIPHTPGQLARVVYQSLAIGYAKTARTIEKLAGRSYQKIHIIGGGAKAAYLNRLTAQHAGKEVLAGPYEATAVGNLMIQGMQN